METSPQKDAKQIRPGLRAYGLLAVLLFLLAGAYAITREQLIPYNASGERRHWLLTGDEPEYLLSALSLARDGDMNVRPNLEREDWRIFQDRMVCGLKHGSFGYFARVSPAQARKDDPAWSERQLLVHRPALSVLIAPAGWSSVRVRWWAYVIVSSFALFGVAAIGLWGLRSGMGFSVIILAGLALTPPAFYYVNQVFPETPMALLLALALVLLWTPTGPATTAAALCIATTPWFSDRAIPPAAFVALVCLVLAPGRKWKAAAAGVFGVSGVFLALYYLRRFGVPFPLHHNPGNSVGLSYLPSGILRQLFDRDRGVIWACPFLMFLPAAFHHWWRGKNRRFLCMISVLTWLSALSVVAAFPNWRGGTCPAGRYGVMLQWLAVPALMFWFASQRPRWQTALILLPLATGIFQGVLLYNRPNYWYRPFHPLFAYPRLTPYYRFFPSLDNITAHSLAVLSGWLLLFTAYVLLCTMRPAARERVKKLFHRATQKA